MPSAPENACELCGDPYHHIHHKDSNHKNNSPENLQKLCTLCHAKVHGIEPNLSELRKLLNYYEKAQSMRVAAGNTVSSYSRIELEVPDQISDILDQMKKEEARCEKTIKQYFKDNPSDLHAWMVSIKGISDILSAKLLGTVDVKNTPSVASLWAYAGLHPGGRKAAGKKSNWNQSLKKSLYQVSDSFIKQRTPRYRDIYDHEKEKQLANGLKKGHADARARRKSVKIFLRDFYRQWV